MFDLQSLVQDLRQTGRSLWRAPGFTVTAVATLAVGIGVNATVFGVVNTVLFKGFPLVRDNDRLLYLTSSDGCCVSYPDFEDWRAQATSFEDIALTHGIAVEYADGAGYAERREVTEVSSNTFALTGVPPILGRGFTSADDRDGAPGTAILSYAFWERRYAKDPSVIGRSVRINGSAATIVGVMPAGFTFPQRTELWTPLIPTPAIRNRENRATWFAVGRLRDGVSRETARAELMGIARRLEVAYPETNRGSELFVQTFQEFFIGRTAAQTFFALWGAVALVTLIACANLANLLLARSIGRARDISVRLALGAGRGRLIRQLLVESAILSTMGGVAAWGLANFALRAWAVTGGFGISDAIPGGWFDGVLDFSMDARVYAYLAGVSLLTGVLFGLAPARRLSKLDIHTSLKDGARSTSAGGPSKRLSSTLVAVEMALAVMLLSGAGMMIRSFLNATSGDLGFDPDHLLIALVELPASRYPDSDARNNFHAQLATRMRALPGVQTAALAQAPPGWPGNTSGIEIEGMPAADPSRRPLVSSATVSSGYFAALGAPVLAGREFNDADRSSGVPVAIVSQGFAKNYWPGQDAIGKRFRTWILSTPSAWRTVVGVAPDVAQNTTGEREPAVYANYSQRPSSGAWLILRTSGAPMTLAEELRRVVAEMDPNLPIGIGPESAGDRLASIHRYRGLMAAVFSLFAGVALALAALGLYAVVAYSIAQRTQELGVRIALGASAGDIAQLVAKQGLGPLVVGIIVGLAGAFAVYRVLQSTLVRVSSADPQPLVGACGLLLVAAALGCWIPARRAMRVDPVVALRHD